MIQKLLALLIGFSTLQAVAGNTDIGSSTTNYCGAQVVRDLKAVQIDATRWQQDCILTHSLDTKDCDASMESVMRSLVQDIQRGNDEKSAAEIASPAYRKAQMRIQRDLKISQEFSDAQLRCGFGQ